MFAALCPTQWMPLNGAYVSFSPFIPVCTMCSILQLLKTLLIEDVIEQHCTGLF